MKWVSHVILENYGTILKLRFNNRKQSFCKIAFSVKKKQRMKIYSVSHKCYFAFGVLGSEDLSYKIKELPKVKWVLPDSYLDVNNKDYGGEPFIDGNWLLLMIQSIIDGKAAPSNFLFRYIVAHKK